MTKAVEFFDEQISAIRYGCITTGLIDTVRVECYDQKLPIKQLAWTTQEKNRICVAPYDQQLLSAIDQGLKKGGFNSYIFSKTQVVVNLPPMSGEDREKVISQISKLGEEAKISIRNIRKKFRQSLTKDELNKLDKPLQAMTDANIKEIDAIIKLKLESLK